MYIYIILDIDKHIQYMYNKYYSEPYTYICTNYKCIYIYTHFEMLYRVESVCYMRHIKKCLGFKCNGQ